MSDTMSDEKLAEAGKAILGSKEVEVIEVTKKGAKPKAKIKNNAYNPKAVDLTKTVLKSTHRICEIGKEDIVFAKGTKYMDIPVEFRKNFKMDKFTEEK